MAGDLFDVEVGQSEDQAVSVVLRVHLQPGAGRSAVTGRYGESLNVRVAARPLEGRANEECVKVLADFFNLPKSAIDLVSGERNREKRLRLSNVDVDDLRRRIETAVTGNNIGQRPSKGRPGQRR